MGGCGVHHVFVRAFLFVTSVSRGPEVRQLLDVSTAQLGLITMAYGIGGLAAIGFAGRLVQRFGSRREKAARRSVFAAINGASGLGMLLAAALGARSTRPGRA